MDARTGNFGKRLIPQILDDLAQSDPHCVVYSLACSPDCSEFRHISAQDFARAVDKTAWWLQSLVGTSQSSQIRPLGYIGPRKYLGHRRTSNRDWAYLIDIYHQTI